MTGYVFEMIEKSQIMKVTAVSISNYALASKNLYYENFV